MAPMTILSYSFPEDERFVVRNWLRVCWSFVIEVGRRLGAKFGA
jgi:hypothetical protein